MPKQAMRKCYPCGGKGYVLDDPEGDPICPHCDGEGEVPADIACTHPSWRWSKFYTYRICTQCGFKEYTSKETGKKGK